MIDERDYLKEKDLVTVAKGILRVLNVLHSRNITLLSLNPDVLTSSVADGSIIPIDYSLILEKPIDHKGINQSAIHRQFFDSNFKYKSPEFLNSFCRDPIDWKSDIFVFGCVMF